MNAQHQGAIRPGAARGRVKSYDAKRSPFGGYITDERSGKDVFFHKSAVEASKCGALQSGSKLEFDIVEDGFGGFRAQNLQVVT
jgi:cold shock CspA family protein